MFPLDVSDKLPQLCGSAPRRLVRASSGGCGPGTEALQNTIVNDRRQLVRAIRARFKVPISLRRRHI